MPYSGSEGVAARIRDALRFVTQAQTLAQHEEEANNFKGADVGNIRLTLARLAHLETLCEHLGEYLFGLIRGDAPSETEFNRGYREAQEKAFAEFDRKYPAPWTPKADAIEPQDPRPASGVLGEIAAFQRTQAVIEKDPPNDALYAEGQLALAAAAEALSSIHRAPISLKINGATFPDITATELAKALWPFRDDEFTYPLGPRRRRLILAAGYLVAEIERVDQAAATEAKGEK